MIAAAFVKFLSAKFRKIVHHWNVEWNKRVSRQVARDSNSGYGSMAKNLTILLAGLSDARSSTSHHEILGNYETFHNRAQI